MSPDLPAAPSPSSPQFALSVVGFSDAEQIEVLRVLAVVLHLGNIKFAEGEREEASVVNRDGAWIWALAAAAAVGCLRTHRAR